MINVGDAEALVVFDEDETWRPIPQDTRPWRILIVDDDRDVHASTIFALSDVSILGRRLDFIHAYSADEARLRLLGERDVAAILLDVVMEAQDAGFRLVRTIREELGLTELRIILRTGQPGYAPEIEAISDFDINDYRTKAELTRTRLITSLTAALRSYEQIRTIAYARRGLEKIVHASADLFEKRALETLAEGVLIQIAGLLRLPPDGLVCAQRGFPLDGSDADRLYVVGALGGLAAAVNRPLDALGEPRIEEAIRDCMARRCSTYSDDHMVLYLRSPGGREQAIFLNCGQCLSLLDRQLLEVFASNISVGFSNVYLFHRVNHLAYHDPLTDLPNRLKLADIVDGFWRAARPFAVILLDINQFADINDVLGGAMGDATLRAVAGRLRARLPESARVGRYSGDVLCVVGDREVANPRAIRQLFQEPFQVGDYQLPISVTLGECAEEAAGSGAEALQNAGLALTHAKATAPGSWVRFSRAMAAASGERLDLLSALRTALGQQRLQVYYQPLVELSTGRATGAEALLRWWREDGREVSPEVFVPLAERSGLIRELGAWVLAAACRAVAGWREQGLGQLRVAVNVSALQIRHGYCDQQVRDALRTYGVSGGQLEIEVTESVLLDDVEAAIACLTRIKALGVRVALDDFGTGFSALSYLGQLPIDAIKVDRIFMRSVDVPGDGGRIGEMIVGLAQHLGLTTVAEGIETERQRDAAVAWGVALGQGYLYAPALAEEDFVDWVRRHGGSAESPAA
jgi:diguanylate cyclase (GGDEF)-like protein